MWTITELNVDFFFNNQERRQTSCYCTTAGEKALAVVPGSTELSSKMYNNTTSTSPLTSINEDINMKYEHDPVIDLDYNRNTVRQRTYK